jgi:ABC-type transport system involved in multi-copper enzyme maturation permease subunit
LILLIAAFVSVAAMSRYTYGQNSNYVMGIDPQNSSAIYSVLSGFQFGLVMLITPALTAGAISGERERQTLNLMLITKMSPFKIAVGKLLSSLSVTLLMIIATMPVFAVVFFYGGVNILDLLGITAYTILSSAAVGSICIFLSSVFKRTVSATVSSYIIVLGLCLGTLVLSLLAFAALNFALNINGNSTIAAFLQNMDAKERSNIFILLYICFFSLNPFVGFLAVIDKQLGTADIDGMFNMVSNGSYGMDEKNVWVYNVIFSILVVAVMLYFTSKVLQPVKASKVRK